MVVVLRGLPLRNLPLIVSRAARLSRPALSVATVGTVALMAGGAAVANALLSEPTAAYVLATSPYYRLTSFVLGVLLALLVRRGVLPAIPVAPAVGLVALHPFMYWAASETREQMSAPISTSTTCGGSCSLSPYGVLILAVSRRDLTNRRSLLRWRP